MQNTKSKQAAKPQWLRIENQGVIPIEAFTLMGASTKRDDSTKIGMFGTGLKYAFATLLREGVEFKVFSGNDEIEFSSKAVTFNGHTFNQIFLTHCEKEIPLSITKEMGGIRWTVNFALREIFSNAFDESGTEFEETEFLISSSAVTRIYVKLNQNFAVDKFWRDRAILYTRFRDPRDLTHALRSVTGYKKSDPARTRFYLKGVLVMDRSSTDSFSLYDWNYTPAEGENSIVPTEERTVDFHDISYCWGFAQALYQRASTELKKEILEKSFNESFAVESTRATWVLRHQDWICVIPDKTVIVTQEQFLFSPDLRRFNPLIVSREIALVLLAWGCYRSAADVLGGVISQGAVEIKREDLGTARRALVLQGIRFLDRYAALSLRKTSLRFFNVPKDKDTELEAVQGTWDEAQNTIWINQNQLDSSRPFIMTLFHELCHRESGAKDSTRAFEDYFQVKWYELFEQIVVQGEKNAA